MTLPKPQFRPERPFFSSGPTVKRPGWSTDILKRAPLGRSNRAAATVNRLNYACALTREVLGIPKDYRILIMPGSNTGAFEAALWNCLGPRPVQVLSFESFSQLWADDIVKHLGLQAEVIEAAYGDLPDLSRIRPECDLVFPWNGTTSGVCMPVTDFITTPREGLVFCDATSAAFCMNLPWEGLDATTFSFQKALGGEAGFGALILSPKAIERLDTYVSNRPLPKVMRLTKNGKSDPALMAGDAINTYSFMVIEDYIDALEWGRDRGGLDALKTRTQNNFKALSAWVERTAWITFAAREARFRSATSVCLKFDGDQTADLTQDQLAQLARKIAQILETEGAAFDILSYRAAPPGLRIWCGPTVETADIEALTPWLDWAYENAFHEARTMV